MYYTGQSSFEVEMAAVDYFDVKTEADSNDITEHPHDDKPRPYVYTTYTVFHKKLYPLLFRYIFSFTKTNFMKIPLSTQEVLVIMSIK